MEIITLFTLVSIAVISATTTFFATKSIYNNEHEQTKAHINNQLIIREERDNAHEYSQTVILVILAVVTSLIVIFISFKCVLNAILRKTQRPAQQQNQAVANAAFEA